MFIAREKEKQIIHKHIISGKFEFGIVYGRRRIGKTMLLKELLKEHPGIYFVADEMGYEYNIAAFAGTVAGYFDDSVTFSNLNMIFEYLCKKSQEQRIIVVIDEFTYLFSSEPGIQSVLQNIIDGELSKSNVVLILSGSQIGMIEEVISYTKPLYGRTTFKLKLESFDYYDAASFYPGFCIEDKIRAYGVFGGTPYYLSKIDDKASLRENIIGLILSEGSVLSEETEFFLKQELRAVISYSMILHSISSGATRLNEISTKAQINNTGTTAKYLSVLRDMDIVEREVCFGESENSKKTLYRIKDNFFDFNYTFVMPNKSKLAVMGPDVIYDRFIMNKIDEYTSFVFERICREFLIRQNMTKAAEPFYEIGRFWGNDRATRSDVEIDIVSKGDEGTTVYECKWTKDLFGKKEATDLVTKSGLLMPYRFGGFSRNGFSSGGSEMLDICYSAKDLFKVIR